MPSVAIPPVLASRLEEARARVVLRRVEAFVDYTPRVCGLDLQPITLATYSRLIAFGSPFVCGGAIDTRAIANFVWIHHPRFDADNATDRGIVFRRVVRALHPRFPDINAALAAFSQLPRLRWLRRFVVPTAAQRHAEAITEIRRLVAEALDDLPRAGDPGEDEDGNPKVESEGPKTVMQAQILNGFARSLHLSHRDTETMPLKRVAQLLRESVIADGGGKGLSMMHPAEAKVWRDYLDE